MLYEHMKKYLESIPGFPASVRQSSVNPIQTSRLPQAGGPQTEFPATPESPLVVRRLIRNTFLGAAFVCLLRSIPEYFVPITWAFDLWGLFASAAAGTIIYCIIGSPTRLIHWFVYLVVLPLLTLFILYQRSMFSLLLLASFFTVIVADRFATHTLFLGTTTPFPRNSAREVRKHWKNRFRGLRAVRGTEFYGFLLLALLALPWIFSAFEQVSTPDGGTFRLPATIATLSAVLCLPIFIELGAAYFYKRPILSVRFAWTAFKRGFREWIAYNPKEIVAPGLLVSPVGTAKNRRLLLVATIYLWSAAFNPILSYKHSTREQLRNARAQARIEHAAKKLKVNNHEEEALRAAVRDMRDRARGFVPAPDRYARPEAAPVRVQVQLQPYQEQLSQRMSEDQRIDYMQRLAASQVNDDPALPIMPPKMSISESASQAATRFTRDVMNPHRTEMFSKGENLLVGFIFTGYLYLIAIRELLLLAVAFSFPLAFLYAVSIRLAASLRQQLETHPDTILAFGNWNALVGMRW